MSNTMFKNVIIYRASKMPDESELDEFVPCSGTQEKAIGWSPPRGEEHGPLIELVNGQAVLKLVTETKSVPAEVVKRKTNERAAQILVTEGRKPGKKEMKEIKEYVKMALLPNAFSKRTTNLVWFTPDGFVVIDASSQAKADDVVTMLVKSFEGLSLTMINTNSSPQSRMANWLITQESPAGFSIDRECELKATDESKAVVKYGRHPLDIDEVKAHVEIGKLPTKLAMTFDGRVSFVLTESMALKKLQILDIVFADQTGENQADAFDADVAIMAGEMQPLIRDLIEAFGGEIEIAAAEAPAAAERFDGDAQDDPLLDAAMNLVVSKNKPSISLVQRHLKIGYNRAARLLEELEFRGVVSVMDSSGQRKILKAPEPA